MEDLKDIFKINKINGWITFIYIIISWLPIPFTKHVNPCLVPPCEEIYSTLISLFGAGGFFIWLFTVICFYIIVSFIYFKIEK